MVAGTRLGDSRYVINLTIIMAPQRTPGRLLLLGGSICRFERFVDFEYWRRGWPRFYAYRQEKYELIIAIERLTKEDLAELIIAMKTNKCLCSDEVSKTRACVSTRRFTVPVGYPVATAISDPNMPL